MAWKVPATLKRAMLRPSASTTLPVPGATSFVSATFTSLDTVFPPFRVMRCPTISQQVGDLFLAGAGGKLDSGARQPLRFGLGVRDGHAEALRQLAGVVVHGLPPSCRT